jgi:anaerobic ribonucleoside-triphosphate reductase activating protein
MLIHNRMESSAVNGPGNRAVIWFQGCSLGCKGCWNPDTHAFDNTTETDLWSMVDWAVGLKDIEGITFSGGEPMQHAPSFYLLMDRIRMSRPELSFGMYSGYSLKELDKGNFKWKSAIDASWIKGSPELWSKVKDFLDFAVLGRYNELVRAKDNSLPLIGSLNQEVVYFTDRYKAEDMTPGYEVTIPEDGNLVQITGFPVGVL